MLDQTEGYTTADGRQIGPVVMEMKNITLRFGGVVAIKDISFDIHEGEIRAIPASTPRSWVGPGWVVGGWAAGEC